jgi:hypothetical protein
MFRALLRTQWRWCRGVIAPATLVAFVLPFLALHGIDARMLPSEVMAGVGTWSPLFPALAAGLGLLTALGTWAPDRRGQHVHALTLPLPRWRYVLLRFAAGATLLGAPIVACVLSTQVATHLTTLPVGLTAYPWSLSFRFAVGVLLAFALFFAILAGTPRTAALVLGALLFLVVADAVLWVVAPRVGLINDTLAAIMNGPGPLALFAGRWTLVDV